MILDHLDHVELYRGLGERIAAGLQALQEGEWARREPGRYEILGSDVFAIVQHYDTKLRGQGRWEAHRQHLDIQYVAAGEELVGHAFLKEMTEVEPYHEEKDVLFLRGSGRFFPLSAGHFAVFFPHDVHLPSLALDSPAPVTKVVVKVKLTG